MKYFFLTILAAVSLITAGCGTIGSTVLPAEDIKIFEVCKNEIAVLKNPRIPANSKQKYEAARSLSTKIDFSYTRTIKFLRQVFLEADARVSNKGDGTMLIIMYYPYEDKFVSFEFLRYRDLILKSNVRYK